MELSSVATFFAGLLTGIFFRSFIDLGLSFAFLIGIISLVIILLIREKPLRLLATFLLAMFLGILRFDLADTSEGLAYLENYEDQTVEIEGVIIDEPKEKDRTTTLVISTSIENGQKFNILILTKPYIKYSYGDRIAIDGKLERVKNFAEDFDYVAYLAKDEIYYQFLNPQINLIGAGEGAYIQEKLFDFKNSFLENISLVVREPESSLMGGIILGAKSSLDKDLTEDFKRVGLIHIVALSGYNVTVVADSLMKVIWFLPLALRLLAGSIVITLFALMTGGGSTVIRASIMVLLAMLARATGRIYLVGSALVVAAAAMILYDPKIFVFDISFQLSFLATAGLIFFTPILEKKLEFITERLGLRGALVSTLSAQLAVWPFILFKMGNFSLVSIPANLLIGPVVPATMFFGFLTGSLGFLNYYLSLFFSFVSYFLLHYIIKVTEIFSSLPFASLDNISFSLWMTVIVYIAYIAVIYSEIQSGVVGPINKIDSKRTG
jgi:competence protein ComEC